MTKMHRPNLARRPRPGFYFCSRCGKHLRDDQTDWNQPCTGSDGAM